MVYRSRIGNEQELRVPMEEALQAVNGNEIQRATQSVLNRVNHCLNVNGRHFEQYR